MKFSFLILLFIFTISPVESKEKVKLSNEIYKDVPFSSQFIDSGALIRNVNYGPVRKLIPQLERIFKLKLKSRGEAHITTITPPEAEGWFSNHKGINYLISSKELHQKYFPILQKKKFKVLCVGRQKNKKGNIVFYLVVETPDLLAVRKNIQAEVEMRAKFSGLKSNFKAASFYPHITIGFVGGDVHGVSKGPETCVTDISFTK